MPFRWFEAFSSELINAYGSKHRHLRKKAVNCQKKTFYKLCETGEMLPKTVLNLKAGHYEHFFLLLFMSFVAYLYEALGQIVTISE